MREIHCRFCWDFSWDLVKDYETCRCGHEAIYHDMGHPHACAMSWSIGSTFEREWCPCPGYVPNYCMEEVFVQLSKIIDLTT